MKKANGLFVTCDYTNCRALHVSAKSPSRREDETGQRSLFVSLSISGAFVTLKRGKKYDKSK